MTKIKETINKKLSKLPSVLMVLLLVGILTACGIKPSNTVQDFMTSFKEGNLDKAATFIEGGIDEVFDEGDDEVVDEELSKDMLKSIGKRFTFKKPVDVSSNENKAEVEVEITSVDVGFAMASTIAEVMPMAFASAFAEQTSESEKAFDEHMQKTVIKHLTSENTPLVTRKVTLNLKKDNEGNFKIVADDNLKEAILANIDTVENMFGESDEKTSRDQESDSAKEIEALSVITENQDYDVVLSNLKSMKSLLKEPSMFQRMR